jgi:F-type H+-transporting ATPase subunit epsilon
MDKSKNFRFEAIKPDGAVLALDAVHEAIIPGALGYFGVRKGHHAFLTTLGVGEVKVYTADETHRFMVADGMCEVGPDKVVVLAETAELKQDIDVQRAGRAVERARERLKPGAKSSDISRARSSLRRAEARLKVAASDS